MKRAKLWLLILALPATHLATDSLYAEKDTLPLSQGEFVDPRLIISTGALRLDDALKQLSNASAWQDFKDLHARPIAVSIDPRSGTPMSIATSDPLIPGTGMDNKLSLSDLELSLGYTVKGITASVVGDRVKQYVLSHADVFEIATDQLGTPNASLVNDNDWQVSIPQVIGGIPVRQGRVLATLNHGNLVLIGTESWGDVKIDPQPTYSAEEALSIGFQYVGGQQASDSLVEGPQLQVVPITPPGRESAYTPVGPIGGGYGHLLVWTFAFERSTDPGRWELMVDAHGGSIVAFEDKYLHMQRQIKGGVYPATETEVCSTIPPQCGEMKSGYPMPWADYNPPQCSNPPTTPCSRDSDCQSGGICQFFFANGGGIFDLTGTATTTLKGKYVEARTVCGDPQTLGPVSVSSSSDIDLKGQNGNHNCAYPPNMPVKDQASLRTSYYEANRIAEIGRGWLPNNNWLKGLDSAGNYAPLRVNAPSNLVSAPLRGQGARSTWARRVPSGFPARTRRECVQIQGRSLPLWTMSGVMGWMTTTSWGCGAIRARPMPTLRPY
jgi:hypothetical protein